MQAIVVGAGIGGLTAAVALRSAGLDVAVYEQADALREVGAGIQLAPNATRLLHRLGLADALRRVGVRPEAIEHKRWQDGRILLRQPLGATCVQTFGAPYYHLYRPDLLGVLAEALPAGVVRLGHRCVAVAQDAESATLTFHNGVTARAPVVIGADGIHSTIRALLLGPESPRFSGSIAYRGLVPAERLAHLGLPRYSNGWLGPDRHFVHYYVGAGARLVNFVAIVPARDWRVESWSATGEVADALAEFDGWHPTVQTIIGAAGRTHRWALYDREPLDTWSAGRVTLLGDAAHAMLPFMAQGACQAVEDAAVLARCLAGAGPDAVPAALGDYETVRKPRVWDVQRASWRNATTYHLPDGESQRERDAAWAASAARGPYAERGWLFAYDAETRSIPWGPRDGPQTPKRSGHHGGAVAPLDNRINSGAKEIAMRAKAAVLHEVKKPLAVEDVDVMEPGPHEVLVRWVANGVCHSDLHVMTGDYPHPLPVVLGHEAAGVVEKVGAGVETVKAGDHVCSSYIPSCGRCAYCIGGQPTMCALRDKPRWFMLDGTSRIKSSNGVPLHVFLQVAGYATHTVLPEPSVIPIRKDAPLDVACLVSCGVLAGAGPVFNRAKVPPGASVAVWGCGGVGLNTIQAAKMVGAGKIIAVDVMKQKLDWAEEFGATHVVDASKTDPVAEVQKLSGMGGVDFAFEVVGTQKTIEQALLATHRGGTCVVVGVSPAGTRLSIDPLLFLQQRVLTGTSFGGGRQRTDVPMLIDLYMDGKYKLDEMITRRVGLDELNGAFQAMVAGEVKRSVVVYQ